MYRSGRRLQAGRAAGAKALRPNELGVFKELGEGQCSWGRVSTGERDVSIKSDMWMGAGPCLKAGHTNP